MNYSVIVLLIIMFGAMYFFTIKPQKKQQEKRAEMLKNMKKGDSIITIGGMKGKIEELDMNAKEVVVDVDGVFLTFDIAAIKQVTDNNTSEVKKVEEKTEPEELKETKEDEDQK